MVLWLSIALFATVGIALILWRKEATAMQEMLLGGRLHPGCAIAEGLLLLLLALAYYLLNRAGLLF
jgi:hypothetical protein